MTEKMKGIVIETQCITRQNYIAKQTVCAAVVAILNFLAGAVSGTALASVLIPLLEGHLCVWHIGLSLGLAAVSAALWRIARWIERYAL